MHYYGKPYGDVYETAYGELTDCKKINILMVGDGPNTDIRGR